jgi:hypothetical protein
MIKSLYIIYYIYMTFLELGHRNQVMVLPCCMNFASGVSFYSADSSTLNPFMTINIRINQALPHFPRTNGSLTSQRYHARSEALYDHVSIHSQAHELGGRIEKKVWLPPQAETTQDYHHWSVLHDASTIRDQPVRIKAFPKHSKYSLRTSDTTQSPQDSDKPKL